MFPFQKGDTAKPRGFLALKKKKNPQSFGQLLHKGAKYTRLSRFFAKRSE